ncbi:MAG TPA: CHAD domain-containing protein [Gaiellaceae bacterium]
MSEREDAIRRRAYTISDASGGASPEENWLQAEQELTVAWEYDTADRDLEALGVRLSRLPSEAGTVWRLVLPRGETVEGWEPGNHGLDPPPEIAALLASAVASKPLLPAPPVSSDPGFTRLRVLLAEQDDALRRHDPGVRIGADAENLHEHRVAARRARVFVRAARASLDVGWQHTLAARLRELGTVTGPVRDLDVLLEHLRAELQGLDAEQQRAGAELLARFERQRADARVQLVRVMDGTSYSSLLTQLRLPPRTADGVESLPLDRLVRKTFKRLASTVDQLGSHPDERELHALRIVLKRARYVAELAAPKSKARKRFLADARRLQDILGEHQDAVVAEERLRSTAVFDKETSIAFLAGRLAERQAARRADARRRVPRAWARLRASGAKLDR